MKKTKKVLSITLICFLALTVMTALSITNRAEATTSADGMYTFEGTTLTGVLKKDELPAVYTVPAEIDGNSITEIGASAFKECTKLETVTIPDSIVTIGSEAFRSCTSLTAVNLGSVTTIGSYAFWDTAIDSITIPTSVTTTSCPFSNYYGPFAGTNLKTVTFADGLTTIPAYCLSGCRGLTTIDIIGEINTIGDYAFAYCSDLTEFNVPESTNTIGNYALYFCISLSSVDLGNVQIIGENAFRNTALNSITIPSTLRITSEDWYTDSVESGGYGPFAGTNLKTVIFADGLTTIPAYCLSGCRGLTTLTIPPNVTNIGNYAIGYCSGITELYVPENVTTIGESAFRSCTALSSANLSNVITIEDYAFINCTCLTEIVALTSASTIGESAFQNCGKLETIDISRVTNIGRKAFEGCVSLQNPIFSNNLTLIGQYAFDGCTAITEITIPPNVTEIGRFAFENCSSLKKVYFNAVNCTLFDWMYSNQFDGCPALTDFIFGTTVKNVSPYACRNIGSLVNVEFKGDIVSIGEFAFAGCTSLTGNGIDLSKVTKFGESAFQNCYMLDNVDFSNTTNIGRKTFSGCRSLQNPIFSNNLILINQYAFDGCTAITEITIPPNVTEIGRFAFQNCSALEKVHFNATNCEIGDWTYSNIYNNCGRLTDIEFGSQVPAIPSKACYGMTVLENVKFNGVITSIGSNAFGSCPLYFEIWFPGTESQWNNITVSSNNDNILSATFTDPQMANVWVHCTGAEPPDEPEAEPVVRTSDDNSVITNFMSDTFDIAPENIVFKVQQIGPEDVAARIFTYGDAEFGQISLFKIYFEDSNGNIIQPQNGKKVKVSIKAPAGIDGSNQIKIAHWVNDDGTDPEILDAQFINGYIVFYTESFSHFAILSDNNTPPVTPTVTIRNFTPSRTVDYKTTISFTATATNAPQYSSIRWFIDGVDRGKQINDRYSVSKATSSFTVQAKLVDGRGNVLAESEVETVNVKTGFFQIILAFFKGLFGLLPVIEQ